MVSEISYQKNSVFLIGLGAIGMGYDYSDRNSKGISHARAIEKHPDFFCIGAFDLDKEKRFLFEKEYGSKAYSSLKIGLQNSKPDVVILATPTKEHLPTLIEILGSCTPKVILCEKPLTNNSDTGEEFFHLANTAKVPVFVNYFRNSARSTFDIKKAISRKAFVQPFFGVCRYNKGTLNTASHFLNLLELWFGSDFRFEVGEQFPNPYDQSDPNSSGNIFFPKGIISLQPEVNQSNLVLEAQLNFQNGVLSYTNEGENINWIPANGAKISVEDKEKHVIRFQTALKDYQYNVLSQLSRFLDRKPHNLCSLASALDYVVKLTQRKA